MSTLEVQNLSTSFHKKKLFDDLNLIFEQGHCYGLFGTNGSGKSTLYDIILGRTHTMNGKILFDGKEVTGSAMLHERVFCAGPHFAYPGDFTVKMIIKFTAALHDTFNINYANELVGKFGINPKTRYAKLSTGEEALLQGILALASSADFIIFDEPDLGVDANHRELFHSELAKKIAEEKSGIIITTHLLDEICPLLEQIIILHEGKILINESVESIEEEYLHLAGNGDVLDDFIPQVGECIGSGSLGRYKSCLVKLNTPDSFDVPQGITASPVLLSTLFQHMTGGILS